MEIKRTNLNTPALNTDLGVKDAASKRASTNGSPEEVQSQTKSGVNVQLSERAKMRSEQFKKAFDIAKATSPVREERVAELRRQIEEGTYKVDPGKIADGMLVEAAKDKVASTTL